MQVRNERKHQTAIAAGVAALLLVLLFTPGLTHSTMGPIDQNVRLDQNYPNPFNGTTVITYSIPVSGHVQLQVFNMLGKEIDGLVDEDEGANEYHVRFDGNALPSGQYTYRLIFETAGSISKLSHKMYLVK